MELAQIKWVHTITGSEGHGEPLTIANAEEWAAEMNKEFPAIKHTVLRVLVHRLE